MKGVLMKVGQLVSFIAEGLPDEAQQALAALQADAAPMAPSLAASVVASRARRADPERVFRDWDDLPVAAASIGQVHRAETDDGRRASRSRCSSPASSEAIEEDLDAAEVMYAMFSALALNGLDAQGARRRAARRGCARSSTTASRRANVARVRRTTSPATRGCASRRSCPSCRPRRVLTTEWVDGMSLDEFVATAPHGDQAAGGRGDLALRPALGPPPRRVQRRPAPGQLPLPPRRQRHVPRLRAREAVGRRASGSASSRASTRSSCTATPTSSSPAMEQPDSSPPATASTRSASTTTCRCPYQPYLIDEFTFTREWMRDTLGRDLRRQWPVPPT